MVLYKILDVFFLVFHSGLILFNSFGWIFPKTRRLNLITLILTGLSWTVLGIWHGLGYCPCTDWHWQVREKLGQAVDSESYIQFLFSVFANVNVTAANADTITVAVYFLSLICSVYVNLLLLRRKANKK